MGVTQETWLWFKHYLPSDITLKICELGDQQFMSCPPFEESSWVNQYFKSIGQEIVTIDLNGNSGALMLDLGKEITDKSLLNTFDIITNFGTSEHVENLYYCTKNIHNMAKQGCLVFNVSPHPDNWPLHGFHFLGMPFYEELAKVCNYQIVDLFKRKLNIGGDDSVQTHCLYQKIEDSVFCSMEEFYKLPICKK
jgi:hypothetical protein